MNDCEAVGALLAESWEGGLDGPARAADRERLEAHLAVCRSCAETAALWQRLGALPAAEPGAQPRERFEQMLAGFRQGLAANNARPARRGWGAFLWHPLPALAAAVLLVAGLAAGVAGGWALHRAPQAGAGTAANTAEQIAELRDEVQSTRQIAVLSLLRQASPNDRLQGVSYSTGMVASDPRVVSALLDSLKYDGSPAVRLAALDALTRHAAMPEIQHGLVQAFSYQKSPLVQVALVDSYVASGSAQARGLLQTISRDKAYEPEVRQRAAWGLAQ